MPRRRSFGKVFCRNGDGSRRGWLCRPLLLKLAALVLRLPLLLVLLVLLVLLLLNLLSLLLLLLPLPPPPAGSASRRQQGSLKCPRAQSLLAIATPRAQTALVPKGVGVTFASSGVEGCVTVPTGTGWRRSHATLLAGATGVVASIPCVG